MGGEVELPMGIDTPGVEEFPRGDETSGVTPKGDGVPEEDGQGRGGERTFPATRETEVSRGSSSDEEMMSGPGPAAPPTPQQGKAAGRGSKVRPHMHPDGARPERASKYGLLAPSEPAGNPAAAEIQKRGDGHEATVGTRYQ